MNYAAIKKTDIANGPGVRVSLFVSGCRHHCEGCFNQETWNFKYGHLYTMETEKELIRALRPNYISGLTLLGGEPLDPKNLRTVMRLVERIHTELPQKTIWCYTGYELEQLMKPGWMKILSIIDVLVDGPFVLEEKDIKLRFRGSRNQRVIDMRKSAINNIVLWKDDIYPVTE